MFLPLHMLILAPLYVVAAVLDNTVTQGRITRRMQDEHDEEVRKQFGWNQKVRKWDGNGLP